MLEGHFPEFDGVDAVYSPRRTVLDAILVDAAREAGAEVREDFIVEGLTTEGGRVTGIRGARKGGATVTEQARFVIGADGKHSMVAAQVGAVGVQEHAAAARRPSTPTGRASRWTAARLYGRDRRARSARGRRTTGSR